MINFRNKKIVLLKGDGSPAELYGPKVVESESVQLLDISRIEQGTLNSEGQISPGIDNEQRTTYGINIKAGETLIQNNINGSILIILSFKVNPVTKEETFFEEIILEPLESYFFFEDQKLYFCSDALGFVGKDGTNYLYMVNKGQISLPWEPFDPLAQGKKIIHSKISGYKEFFFSGKSFISDQTFNDDLHLTFFAPSTPEESGEVKETKNVTLTIVKDQNIITKEIPVQLFSLGTVRDSYENDVIIEGQHFSRITHYWENGQQLIKPKQILGKPFQISSTIFDTKIESSLIFQGYIKLFQN